MIQRKVFKLTVGQLLHLLSKTPEVEVSESIFRRDTPPRLKL